MLPARWQRFTAWLLDNVADLIALLVAAVLLIRYQIQSPTIDALPEIAAGILAVLSLMAVSGLVERNRRLARIETLAREGRDLALRQLNRRAYASDFFLSDGTLATKDLAAAHEVWFLGRALARTSREFMHVIGLRLAAGARVRFIVLDPESDAVIEQAVLQTFGTGLDFWRATLRTTETVIEALANAPNVRGQIELGYLPFVPSFGLAVIDPYEAHGRCFVEMYQHHSSEPHPTFELYAATDPHWYEFFRNQFDTLWASCRIVDLVSPDRKRQSTPAQLPPSG